MPAMVLVQWQAVLAAPMPQSRLTTMYAPLSSTAAPTKKSDAPGLQIRLLGEFAFDFQGRAVAAQAWQRSHARRLLQLLCSAPKFTESRGRVLSSLWPDSDEAKARNRLHHTVHCVRKAWEEIPAAERPQIVVGTDRVQFVPGPRTVIDVQVFLQGVESDCTDAPARLAAIEHALERYKGDFAPGWDDCAEIERRRAWLEKLRAQALQEAVDTAVELCRPAVALHHAHQLALLSQSDCQAHCQYALLLADNQRPDAALLHCQAVRPLIEADDAPSLPRLDETIQAIQQRANRRTASVTALPLAADLFTASVILHSPETVTTEASPAAQPLASHTPVSQGLVSRLCVAAPTRQALGYDSLVQLCTQCIADPYGSLTTVVGPPGSGKSLLAATVAHTLQSQMQHGALWLDCTAVHDAASLLQVMAEGLDPLCGTLQANEATLSLALHNKELLIVLDGLNVAPSTLRLGPLMALAGRDTRWLVTSWSARHLLGERLVAVEASQLLALAESGGPSQAAEILLGVCAPMWRYQDARTVQLVEQICGVLDGLPQSLVIAGEGLRAMSPSELLARLQRDPCALMRGAAGDVESGSSQLARTVSAWLEHATPSARPLLNLLSQCRSWLTRPDIERLMGEQPGIDALIEHCVRHQFLLRRAQAQASGLWSEFRVPRIVIAALRLGHDAAPIAACDARIQAWLLTGAQSASSAASAGAGNGALPGAGLTLPAPAVPALAASRWFDDHIADLDAAALACIDSNRVSDLAALCLAHAPHWSLPQHAPRLQVWMDGLGSTLNELPPSAAASLLVARARLRVHLGELHLACDDASRALARIVGDRDADLRHQAVQLLQRYGACAPRAVPTPKTLSGRGVEAGESLLRVSQLAVRHGQLVQALSLCRQAIEVFAYFGFSYGLIKAQHYRAKIAFALGDTETASRCLTEIERVATQSNDRREAARAALMRAHVLMSQMRFSQAVDLASSVVAQPECADDVALLARGTSVVAWSHYGQGAYPLAHALCGGLRVQAHAAQGLALRANTEILSALIEAQSRRPEAAIRSACAALELLAQEQPLPDAQSDLVNGAELAMCLGRADLAAPLMQSLDVFSSQPEHRLRDWVDARMRALKVKTQPLPSVQGLQPEPSLPTLSNFVPRSFSEVLADLTAA
jgi:DNA-binding SARP family transcriptional activator/tetratricopeptide (TPR) repeat protein